MDADDLINKEQFIYENCILTKGTKITAFTVKNNKVYANENTPIDESNLIDIFFNFSMKIGNAVYAGGESSAHGSCGFFCKKLNGKTLWLLMSTESDPFIGVECQGDKTYFLSSSGYQWVVQGDDIHNTSIIMR